MVRKRASLEDKGEEILGIEPGGKGADILFGTEGESEQAAEPDTSEPEIEGAPSQEDGLPQGEADLDETLGDEVRSELEAFAENKSSASRPLWQIRTFGRYITTATLREWDMSCLVGYRWILPTVIRRP